MTEETRLRFDLHTHTHFSADSGAKFADIVAAVRRRGLDGIAVTDHNRLEGALQLKEVAPFTVIVGEEIRTSEGEIIGLFLSEEIPARLSPEETVERIKAQGGLVYIPHPFDRVRPSHLRKEALYRLIDSIDAVEVVNSRTTLPLDNRRAELLCQRYGLRRGAGSDAHLPREIGQAWVEIPPFANAAEFLSSLEQGRAVGRLTTPLAHLATRWHKLRRRFRTSDE
ncbi:MAG: PHP domain-containing protein [Chloroflexota bacterium]